MKGGLTTADTKHQVAHRQQAEAAALADVSARPEGQRPEMDRVSIERVVHGRQGAFECSVVRDFVPILVQRSARKDLQL